MTDKLEPWALGSHTVITAVCGALVTQQAPQRKQAAKPKILPLRPITDPTLK